jgi:hypothetical protein
MKLLRLTRRSLRVLKDRARIYLTIVSADIHDCID